MFIVLAFTAFNADNIKPFAPSGTDGIVSAASLIFFAYIGFDAISTSGEETKNPQKHLPIAIIGSLAVATLLYILVALAATGAIPYKELDGSEAPLADALSEGAGFTWGATVLSIGALIAITSVVLTVLYGQTRIMFAMSRDGLVPRWLAYVHPKTRTPVYTTAGFALLIALLAAVVPLAEIAKLVNIGTLFAFLLVNIGVMVLRRTQAGPRARLPRPGRLDLRADRLHPLPVPDDRPARDDVGAVRDLAAARAGHLLLLRAQALAAAAGRGRQPGGAVRRGRPRSSRAGGGAPARGRRLRAPLPYPPVRDDERVAAARARLDPQLDAAARLARRRTCAPAAVERHAATVGAARQRVPEQQRRDARAVPPTVV